MYILLRRNNHVQFLKSLYLCGLEDTAIIKQENIQNKKLPAEKAQFNCEVCVKRSLLKT